MTQFKITDWCDFVRGVAETQQGAEMRRELEAGEAPSRMIDMLSLVAEVGRLDSALEIPEHAVRVAKAAGSLARPHHSPEAAGERGLGKLLRYLPFSITFDSFSEPALAGTRSLQGADRRLSVEAEAYKIDLRVEHDTEPQSTVVVGQLLRRTPGAEGEGAEWVGSEDPMPDIPVLALEAGQIVGRSRTGRFGEFQAEGLPNSALSLCLLVGTDECIELPLDR